MYAVCKNGRCAQTYHLDDIIKGRTEEVFLKDIRITKGYRCEKCGAVVVEPDGTAMLSQHATVIPYTTVEELEENRKRRLKEKRRELRDIQQAIKLIESEE